MVAILDIETEHFQQFWISLSLWCLPSSFGSIPPTVWEEVVWRTVYKLLDNVAKCQPWSKSAPFALSCQSSYLGWIQYFFPTFRFFPTIFLFSQNTSITSTFFFVCAFLAHLSTKCSRWTIVIGLCPSSICASVPPSSTFALNNFSKTAGQSLE